MGDAFRFTERLARMKLVLAGINHKTAPVEVREQLALTDGEVPAVISELQASGAAEAVILSTCNRVEVAAALDDNIDPEVLVATLIGDRIGLTIEAIRPHVYIHQQREAIRHLFRVASSLDSMIVGEPQILGQMKQAYAQARDLGAIGTVLDAVLTRAFHVAKRVRTETEIGQSAVSVSFAAVELAREIFGSLSRKRILIVGAGKMSEATARHLLRAGVAEILITNRTPERADDLARLFRGTAIPYDAFPHRLHDVDIVITSSAAPDYVLNTGMVRSALETRKNEPMFFIDIAVPRNVNPAVNKIEHAFLYDMDDLSNLASRNLQTRREVAQQAESIVNDEVGRMEVRLRERDVAPTIQSLQAQLESIRQDVLDRYRPRLGSLTIEQEQLIDSLTRGIVNKIAHGPISEIRRNAAVQTEGKHSPEGELLSAVRRMFRLGDRSS
ncbi:MAG TPA: glutamyl-tRNA reductase [Bryobacteraceae bacterium]|nr:glutamyl-tRNA reductase [Bryobacteraceae bacterium]